MSDHLNSSWLLRLDPDFRLENPAGEFIPLATKKTEALLTLLTIAGPSGMRSADLKSKLWATKTPEQASVNLRQTLRRLRQGVGSETIVSTDGLYRLGSEFEIKIEHGDKQGSASVNANWLNEFAAPVETVAPLSAFLLLVRWATDNDPIRAIDLLSSNHDFSLQLAPSELRPIALKCLERIPESDQRYAWAVYFMGMVEFQSGGFHRVAGLFNRALELAQHHNDEDLAVLSGIFVVSAAGSYGHVAIGRRALAKLERTVQRHPWRHVRGLLLLNEAQFDLFDENFEGAIQLFERSKTFMDRTPHDMMQVDLGWATCLATLGRLEEAQRLLENPSKMKESSDFTRLEFLIKLTRQIIWMRSGDSEQVVENSLKFIKECDSTGSLQIALKAREVLAISSWNVGEKDSAITIWNDALRLRRRLGLKLTNWDRVLLQGFPPAAEANAILD